MSKIVAAAKEQLHSMIENAFSAAISAGELPEAAVPAFTLEKPSDRSHGDWATNAAMAGARNFRSAPRKIAETIVSHMNLEGTYFEKCEIAGPGFINFFLSPVFYAEILKDINTLGSEYGKSDFGKGQRVLVEFVSANPTGPMHIGNARGGAIGDCLASVLEEAGYEVDREFYVNDAGNQVAKFGLSLDMRYKQLFDPNGGEPSPDDTYLPEDSYHGMDIIEHAKNFAAIHGDKYINATDEERRKALVDYALPLNIEALERDLKKYRIVYDNWFRESTVHNNGDVDKVINTLTEKGYTYEMDGATWFKATEFGNEKDIVLRRENGFPTYIVPDIAYHYDKLVTRGYDKAINIWGADHHGYVPRLKGALTAYGADADKLDIILMQMVRILIDGQPVKQSKRSGKAITLNTLLDEVPIDAARFFFNLREANSMFDFDYDLAVSESSANPVY
ncbi:MAG: arginine--tRNA ligase, partial [Clostridia bacterium]|nr:arginine--tRNA ligase [Clostridia bacterium]